VVSATIVVVERESREDRAKKKVVQDRDSLG